MKSKKKSIQDVPNTEDKLIIMPDEPTEMNDLAFDEEKNSFEIDVEAENTDRL